MSLVNLSNSSLDSVEPRCANNTDGAITGIALIATRVFFFFPVSLFILCHGLQQQRSFKARSHFEVLTYHQCFLELIWILGIVLQVLGSNVGLGHMTLAGNHLTSCIFSGVTLFHVLTCVDRYLAVVHPVIYHSLRDTRGARIRNMAVFAVWLLISLFSCAANNLRFDIFNNLSFSLLGSSLVLMSFCGFSVLCALIGPGPGETGGNKRFVHQKNLRAFVTVTVITVDLCLWFFVYLVSTSLLRAQVVTGSASCVLEVSVLWFSLPSSMILPLLYLLKMVKLPSGKQDSD